jgi:DNA-binding NarL/FixJ family response regulator
LDIAADFGVVCPATAPYVTETITDINFVRSESSREGVTNTDFAEWSSLRRRIRWTPEEDERLLNLIAAGKSWTLISGMLKRSMKSVKLHAKTLVQKDYPKIWG